MPTQNDASGAWGPSYTALPSFSLLAELSISVYPIHKCDFFEGRDWTGVPFDEFSRLLGEYIEWYRDSKLKKDLGWKTIREYREERGHAA